MFFNYCIILVLFKTINKYYENIIIRNIYHIYLIILLKKYQNFTKSKILNIITYGDTFIDFSFLFLKIFQISFRCKT